jgi:hypothetical protein
MRNLLVVLGVLMVLSGGFAFASDPEDGEAADAVQQQGPFCFRVAQANPVRPITNLKLVIQQERGVPFFPILGQEFGGPSVSLFLFGMALQVGPNAGFNIASGDVSGGKFFGRLWDASTSRTPGRGADDRGG